MVREIALLSASGRGRAAARPHVDGPAPAAGTGRASSIQAAVASGDAVLVRMGGGLGAAARQVPERVNSGSGETCSGAFRGCLPHPADRLAVGGAQGLRQSRRQVPDRVNSGSDETCSHAFRPSFLGLRWLMREEPETCRCRFRRMSQFDLRPCWGSPNPVGIPIRATLGPGPGVPGSEGSPSGSSRATRRDDR